MARRQAPTGTEPESPDASVDPRDANCWCIAGAMELDARLAEGDGSSPASTMAAPQSALPKGASAAALRSGRPSTAWARCPGGFIQQWQAEGRTTHADMLAVLDAAAAAA